MNDQSDSFKAYCFTHDQYYNIEDKINNYMNEIKWYQILKNLLEKLIQYQKLQLFLFDLEIWSRIPFIFDDRYSIYTNIYN